MNGRLEIVGERLASADLSLGGGKGSAFRSHAGGGRDGTCLYVADFGMLLKDAGWLDGLAGGYLHFQGRFDDPTSDAQLTGILKLGPYRMVKVDAACRCRLAQFGDRRPQPRRQRAAAIRRARGPSQKSATGSTSRRAGPTASRSD